MATATLKLRGSSLYLRYSNGRSIDLETKTGITVQPEIWDSKKQQLRNVSTIDDRTTFNNKLTGLKAFVLEKSSLAFMDGEILDITWLREAVKTYFNRPKNEVSGKNEDYTIYLTDFADWWIKNHAASWKVGPRKYMNRSAISQYEVVALDFMHFQKKDKVKLRELTSDKMEEFAEYLTDLKFANSTVKKKLDRLRFLCSRAIDNGIQVNPGYKAKIYLLEEAEVEDVYLNENEIDRIYNLDLSDNYELDNVRDNLIIACMTSLRLSDFMHNLDASDIKDGFIKIKTKKTNIQVTIPVHSYVSNILNKRMGQLPAKTYNIKFNKLLKEVCKKAGINQVVFGSLYDKDKDRKVTGYFEKWQLCSSHIGRKSFVSNHIGKVPDEILQSIGGWRTKSMLQHYSKVSKQEKAEQLQEYWTTKK